MRLSDVLNQFLLDCEIRGRSHYTLTWYRQRLGLLITTLEKDAGVTELEQVTIAHLRQFVQMLLHTKANANNPRKPTKEKPLSVLTVRGYVRAIKAFFSWCVYEDLLESNPSAKLVQPKAPHYLIPTLSSEQIEAMLETCDLDTPVGFRNYVLLLAFLDTGMRLSELCNPRVNDVHNRYVKVLGKGCKEREIGIYPEVGKVLWKYIHKYRKPNDPSEPRVFIGRGGEALDIDGVQKESR